MHLLLHRFGVFDFAGFGKAPNADIVRYSDEVRRGLYSGESSSASSPGDNDLEGSGAGGDNGRLVLPWTYTPAKEASVCLALLEELLHLLIVLMTELTPPSPKGRSDHASQAKLRLRREVVHKLVSGPKTHSELAEVHHVLPNRDNDILSEEGKLVNPDDATGAALEAVLAEVADRKVSRGKLAADHWELRRWAWAEYDPAFFHMSLRCHQIAAEKKPAGADGSGSSGPMSPSCPIVPGGGSGSAKVTKPYAPRPPPAHPSFARIRRDVTVDAAVLAVVYRTLHVHCRKNDPNVPPKSTSDLRGAAAYERDAMSETVLARAVHLLTLGAYAWQPPLDGPKGRSNEEWRRTWRSRGGGGRGSVFHHYADAPAAADWIRCALLTDPAVLTDCDWYRGQENALLLLHRLAKEGGSSGSFVAQDAAVRSGAAWVCDFAASHSPGAAKALGRGRAAGEEEEGGKSGETEMERRKREAKERATKRVQANAAKFKLMMQSAGTDEDEEEESDEFDSSSNAATGRARSNSAPLSSLLCSDDGKPASGTSVAMDADSQHSSSLDATSSHLNDDSSDHPRKHAVYKSPARLLKERPRCIICVEDSVGGAARGGDAGTSAAAAVGATAAVFASISTVSFSFSSQTPRWHWCRHCCRHRRQRHRCCRHWRQEAPSCTGYDDIS